MKNAIQFLILFSDGYYTAEAVGHPIVTQGKTFEDLQKNIREVVALYLEGENLEELGLSQAPSLLANFEIPKPAYAS